LADKGELKGILRKAEHGPLGAFLDLSRSETTADLTASIL
jgi:hypothetical protein